VLRRSISYIVRITRVRVIILSALFLGINLTIYTAPLSAAPEIVRRNWYVLPGNTSHILPESVSDGDFKFVCITIDDVPDAVYTKQILEILSEHRARATFFVNGARVKAFPQTARMMAARGHEIGNHTWSHPDMTKLSASKMKSELSTTQDIVKKTCGVTPRFYRPPYGRYNAQTNAVASNLGLITLLWSIDTLDWQKPGVETIRRRVMHNLHNGAVVLLHGTNNQTPQALELILSELSKNGYIPVTASEWFQLTGGKAAFDFDSENLPDSIIDYYFDRQTIIGPKGQAVEILIPRPSTDGIKLSTLKTSADRDMLSIYSNLDKVETDDVPFGLRDRRGNPPNLLRVPHNCVELRLDGNDYGFELTDKQGPEFDRHYYPRPKLVMFADVAMIHSIDMERLELLYESAGFDRLIILVSGAGVPEPDLSLITDGIECQVITNNSGFPPFFLIPGQGLMKDYIDVLREKRDTISVYIDSNTFSETAGVQNELRNLIEFRRFTGSFTYDPADDLRERWNFPADVEICRFTGYERIVVMLFSRTSETFELQITEDDDHFELLSGIDPFNPSYENLAPETTIPIGTRPVYLVYRWGASVAQGPEGPG